jgi:hypothetical protein
VRQCRQALTVGREFTGRIFLQASHSASHQVKEVRF